jgi:O-antigen ligase
MIEEKNTVSGYQHAVKGDAVSIAGYALIGVGVGFLFLFFSGREVRWLIGFTLLVLFLSLFAIVKNKKMFLLCFLFISFVIRTNINLWLPHATVFSTGSGTTTTAVELFAFDPALILLSFYLLLTRDKNKFKEFRTTDIAALFFLFFCTLSLVNSSYPNLTLVRLPVMARMPLIYYCLSRGVTSRREVKVLSCVIIGLVLLESVLAILQTNLGSFHWVASIVERKEQVTTVELDAIEVGRATGTIGYTTVFAQWLGMLSPIALAFVIFSQSNLMRLSAGATYVLAIVALILAVSRAEWLIIPIVFAILLIIWFFKKNVNRRSSTLVFTSMFIVVGLVVALKYNLIAARLTAPDSESAYIRIPMMKVAFRMIANNPIFGVGLHNYTQVMRSYGIAELIPGWNFGVHNSFLYLWAETGPFCLLAILSLWFITIKRLIFCLKKDDGFLWKLAAGMLCGLAALFIHSQVEEGYHVHQVLNATLWAYFGLAAALKAMVIRRQVMERR